MADAAQRGIRRTAVVGLIRSITWALLLLACITASIHAARSADASTATTPLTVGLTPVFLQDQSSLLQRWRNYLSERLARPVEFVQRQSYREIIDLLKSQQIDIAWVCGFPYVTELARQRLLAVPVFRGRPLYQSYLIVPTSDSSTGDITDLRDTVFAYSDPDSNSGWLVPQVSLLESGHDPANFFRKTFFTWSHRSVVTAVADGLAQAGAVDGYVWEALSRRNPELARSTRVVWRSAWFGFPPFVASSSLDSTTLDTTRKVLLSMDQDAVGRALLDDLELDGFAPADDTLFDGIRASVRRLRTNDR